MPLQETLPVGPDTAQWSVWSTTARVVVTDPATLPDAEALVRDTLASVDEACSRFRDDSELVALRRAAGRPVRVSPLLAELIEAALVAAERSDGDVDPTIGGALSGLGYDRDLSQLPRYAAAMPIVVQPAPGWRHVRLDGWQARLGGLRGKEYVGRELTVPPGVELDLGATAKAFAADRCAHLVAQECGVGVLVSLGGDIATAGPAPDGGWRVLVQDRPGDPQCTVAMPAGAALATSSTAGRRWQRGERILHHILDPRTCQPAPVVWRTVTVAAYSCLDANTMTTASLVRGHRAPDWLREQGVAARLVTADGHVVIVGDWPATTTAPARELTEVTR
jgi:thiamine biosynthesis lipoprotein